MVRGRGVRRLAATEFVLPNSNYRCTRHVCYHNHASPREARCRCRLKCSLLIMLLIPRVRMMIDVMIDVRNAKCQIVDRVASCAVRSEILVSTRIPGMYIHRARLAFSLDPCGLQT